MKSHESGQIHCPKCPHFSCTSESELAFHVAKKHPSAPEDEEEHFSCLLCKEKFGSYYSLNNQKRTVHGVRSTKKLENYQADLSTYENDDKLLEEMKAVQHFLIPTVHESKHQTAFTYPLETASHEEVYTKLMDVFEQVPCAIKLNIAFGFVLRNVAQDTYEPYC